MKEQWKQNRKKLQMEPRPVGLVQSSTPLRSSRTIAGTEGSQLLEFALVLPFLLVFLVGIVQFGGAFNLKQKMANAAREGARIVVSSSMSDNTCSTSSPPCAIQAAAAAVADYMTQAGENASCINPSAPTSSAASTWTYGCSDGTSLTIDHNSYFTSSTGETITGTKVTLTYPYRWFFTDILKLLVPNSSLALPTTLAESAFMQNLTAN